MSEDHLEKEVLGKVRMDRRNFIKKAIVGTAFAIPAIASFDMLAMSGSADGVTCTAPNQQSGGSGSGTTGGAGGSRKKNNTDGACPGTPDGGVGGAAGTSGGSDRAIKTDIIPIAWS